MALPHDVPLQGMYGALQGPGSVASTHVEPLAHTSPAGHIVPLAHNVASMQVVPLAHTKPGEHMAPLEHWAMLPQ